MQAIILAAGMGKRLGEYTSNNTKCMVKVNGRTLIERALDQLSEMSLHRVVIVVGYERRNLMEFVGNSWKGLKVEYVENSIYDKTNNIYSLALAKDKLMEDDTILLESDLIFEDGVLSLLLDSPSENVALVAKYESWMDGTMVCIDRDCNIVNFVPKEAFNYKNTDEYYKTVNIYKFSKEFSRSKYVPFLEAYTKSVGNNEYYENVLRIISFLNSKDLKALPVGERKWYEIDDKQDLDIAQVLFSDTEELLKSYYTRYGGFWRFPQMLDFNYLVNPYFHDSKIIDELEANFRTLIGKYPSGMRVNTLLASKCWGVKEQYVVPGNGAAELIRIMMKISSGKVGIVRPTFEEYPNRTDEAEVVPFIPSNPDFRYGISDLMEYFDSKDIKSLVVINPDNPSGNFIPKDDILKLAGWCETKGIRLIVDESFVDFCNDWETSSLLDNEILEKHGNLIVIKSISKSYGVPGLRLGILASSDIHIIDSIKRESSIWNINSFAEFFMQIFSKYEKDYKKSCEKFIEVRNEFYESLKSIPFLRVMPSQANFFLCEVKSPFTANTLAATLLKKHNILISACSAKKGIEPDRFIRIAVRNRQDNETILTALKELI